MFQKLINITVVVTVLYLLLTAWTDGVDQQIDNQNQMLCESALISGNREYQEKCAPYYESHNITIVRESL